MCGVVSSGIVFGGWVVDGGGGEGGSVSDYRIRNVFITSRIRPAENMLHLAPGDLPQLRCLLICRWVELASVEHEVIRFLITHIIT